MKTYFRSLITLLLIAACFCILLATGCKKDKDDNTKGGIFWNENWLIGTWEATTPANTDPLFNNKKIRIIFDSVALKAHDTLPHNTSKLWLYSGTLTWDVDAGAPWSMRFFHSEYPTGINSCRWQSSSLLEAGMTINTISLRIGDSVNMQPNRELDFDLDWGPYNDYNGKSLTSLDFYGDIEIYVNEVHHDTEYSPDAGTKLRFTKK